MANHLRDLTGQKFGHWVVLQRGEYNKSRTMWVCQCRCGTEREVAGNALTRKKWPSQSCGCSTNELISAKKTRHGHARDNLRSASYGSWMAMVKRCGNSNDPAYKRYGGRGIYVDPRWLKFENFLEDMGDRPLDRTLDRIDNDKGYTKDNCRWATKSQQANNRRKASR